MADIIVFTPRTEGQASQNVADFIECCKKITVFGQDLDWDAPRWVVTDYMKSNSRTADLGFNFSNHDTSKENTNAPLMALPFLDFAKAYMRYQHAMKFTSSFNFRLSALRALERALIIHKGSADISLADFAIFNHAENLIKQKFKPSSADKVAGQLATIGKFINDKGFVPARFQWKKNLKRVADKNKVGKQADKDRLEKLPRDGAIDALAKAFCLAVEPEDVLIASTGALLMTAPSRINEVFRLPVNCEVEKKRRYDSMAYGLRWWPAKGAEPYVKWIGTTMIDVAKEAISNLREVTKHARSVAKWYEDNPGSMWLPTEYEYLRTQELASPKEYAAVLGVGGGQQARQWMVGNNVELHKINNRSFVRFDDVQNAVLAKLPEGFPIFDEETRLTYSEALMLVPFNFFHQKRGTCPCLFEKVVFEDIANGLGSGVEHGKSSLFTRRGLRHEDGSEIKIKTHQFRHWLNTIAQKGGLSQLDIAKWSGRKDVQQNAVYDHVTDGEMLTIIRDKLGGENMMGPLNEAISHMPVTREEFLQMKFPTAHTTEYGFCIHDFAMLPCQRHLDCINCTEHLCVKGDVKKEARLRAVLEDVKRELNKSEDALNEEVYGATTWLKHHRLTAMRMQGILDIYDDDTIPKGSVIQLAIPSEYSPIGNAVDDRILLEDEDAKILARMRAIGVQRA